MQYTVGDRCQVRLEGSGRSYNATVKEVPTINDNMVTVHIEELGKRKSMSTADSASFGLTKDQRSAKDEEDLNMALLEIQLRDENSFPALGSPVEDVRAASPSAGERPKSSTPPATTTAAAAPTAPTNPTLLPAAAAPTAPTNPTLLPAAAAPATKTNAQRSSPTAAAAKPSVTGGALPPSVPCSASVFSFLTPVLPTASSPPSLPTLSSPPPISASPPPPSLVPQPTFIAPIALSPGAAQGFHPPSSCLHRTSPPVPSLPHSPSPPTSSLIHHPASRVREAPPAAAQTPNALPDSGGCLTKSQASQNQSHIPVSQTQTPVTHTDAQTPASLPKIQYSIPQHQSLTEVSQNQIQDSVLQPQAQSDMVQIQASHPPPGASYTLTPQASVPVPGSAQPPHPSQLPHPSLCVSASPTHPPLPAQTPDARFQTEGPRPPAHPPSQQPHPAHHPQSIPGSVPLQSLAQLYQDPLYPGFPQGETGDMAQTPSFSSNISGDDLPQDFNILRFFFNLGVKGYHPAQSTGHPLYPPTMPQYPLSSLGYQSSSTPDEHHGAMEQLQPPNGDVVPGRGPGPLDGPAAANVANANNNNRAMMLPGVNSFALKNEQGESLTRTVLLVDPPLNNRPILALVSNSSDPISMATMNPCSSPGSPSPYGTVSKTTVPGDNAVYRVHPSHFNPGKTYMSREIRPPAMPTLEALSVGCGMEEDWEEPEGFKPTTLNNPRGAKRPYRGGRGRGGGAYDGDRVESEKLREHLGVTERLSLRLESRPFLETPVHNPAPDKQIINSPSHKKLTRSKTQSEDLHTTGTLWRSGFVCD
ncbi:hypothetical protein F2P81_018094 [Scophthalmus maximus]|uniref:Uncharacterized protein n=1 Tax=Scophthalmus maximus TaxID=52904 RepID=A0A6A4S8V9_SCOMX|nr:hypothetical protein F2P81_018094 [Scophthalmus maximus]